MIFIFAIIQTTWISCCWWWWSYSVLMRFINSIYTYKVHIYTYTHERVRYTWIKLETQTWVQMRRLISHFTDMKPSIVIAFIGVYLLTTKAIYAEHTSTKTTSSGGGGSSGIRLISNTKICDSFKGLSRKQIAQCKREPELIESIAFGVHLAVAECRHHFRNNPWNCTQISENDLFRKIKQSGESIAGFRCEFRWIMKLWNEIQVRERWHFCRRSSRRPSVMLWRRRVARVEWPSVVAIDHTMHPLRNSNGQVIKL